MHPALSPRNSATRLRPYLAAGVALAGATLIAVNPVAPSASGLQERAVQLASSAAAGLPDPITEWINVIEAASTNLTQIGNEIAADPAPVLSQIITNQLAFSGALDTNLQSVAGALESFLSQGLPPALQAMISSIQAGDISDAVNNFNGAVLLGLLPAVFPLQTILQIPGEMAQNLTNAIDTLPNVGLQLLLAPVGLWLGTSQAWADSTQAVVDAFNAGQTTTALTDLLNMPATVTGALLNGYSTEFADYIGLLSSGESPSGSGLLYDLLVQVPQEIAQALGASASTGAAAALDPASMMADLSSLLDPSALTDIGSNLGNMVADLLASI